MPTVPRSDEVIARAWLNELSGWRADHYDDGSAAGMVDLLLYDDKSCLRGAIEVTRFTDRQSCQTAAEWAKSQRQLYRSPVLSNSWVLTGEGNIRFKGIAERVEPFLLALEQCGISEFGPLAPLMQHECCCAVVRGLYALGITDGEIAVTKVPATIHISHFVAAEVGSPEETLRAVERFLGADQNRDVRTKLRKSLLAERHAFVWVDRFNLLPIAWPISAQPPPGRAPILPLEITHLWLAAAGGDVWRWAPEAGWNVHRGLDEGPQGPGNFCSTKGE